MSSEAALDPIDQALADLDRAREVCVAALDDRHMLAVDKVKAAAELRLLAKQRLELIDRQADQRAAHQHRADAGVWRNAL